MYETLLDNHKFIKDTKDGVYTKLIEQFEEEIKGEG